MGTEETLIPAPGVFEACIRCGHRSYVFAVLLSGKMISYCGHDYDQVREKLDPQCVTVIDRRYLLENQRV